jgi:hypothetical protein
MGEIPSQTNKKLNMVARLSSQLHGRYKQEDHGPGHPWARTQDPIQKNKAKRARGMAHLVEHMPSKYKALNSNPSTKKKKKGTI